jgi:signal transduction histidine kinase
VTDLDRLWLSTLEEVVGRAAHEVKDALNGVSINVEAVRSRASRKGSDVESVAGLAAAAANQLEVLTARTEALLFLARPHRPAIGSPDIALTLRHLAALLVPAARSDGGSIQVEGYEKPVQTAAPAQAVRLALAAGLLGFGQKDRGRCSLEGGNRESGQEPVVRFSHESAGTCSLDTVVAKAIAMHNIRAERSGPDLNLWFPGS